MTNEETPNTLKEIAREFIRNKDHNEGAHWTEDEDELASTLVEFHNKQISANTNNTEWISADVIPNKEFEGKQFLVEVESPVGYNRTDYEVAIWFNPETGDDCSWLRMHREATSRVIRYKYI